MDRTAQLQRKTKETEVEVSLCLEGGAVNVSTGVGFFDHMLRAFAVHGGFGLQVHTVGDWEVDCHHTVEDTGIVLGQAFAQALGERAGIRRYGSAFIPMDDATTKIIPSVKMYRTLPLTGHGQLSQVPVVVFPIHKHDSPDVCIAFSIYAMPHLEYGFFDRGFSWNVYIQPFCAVVFTTSAFIDGVNIVSVAKPYTGKTVSEIRIS